VELRSGGVREAGVGPENPRLSTKNGNLSIMLKRDIRGIYSRNIEFRDLRVHGKNTW